MTQSSQSDQAALLQAAADIRPRAYAPYSGFAVGAAIRAADGVIYCGVNVENVAYPQGTCAEAGAIAAMVAAGQTRILAVAVIAEAPEPVTPCGGCRQKLAEFAAGDVPVTMATTQGGAMTMTMAELLPGAFAKSALGRG